MSKKIVITSACMACGLCISSPYIEEKPDGTAAPKGTGILPEKEETTFQNVVDECPAKAIQLVQVSARNKEDIIDMMNREAEDFNVPVPPKSDFKLEEQHIVINAPRGVPGEYRAEYSSYNRAKEAAKQAIDSAFFSQRKTAVQNVINNYQVDKLSGYYEYKENESNFYYSANKQAQKVLDRWIQEIQVAFPTLEIPDELLQIQTRLVTKGSYSLQSFIKKDLLNFTSSVLGELSDSVYSLSSYAEYCDIDEQEEFAGTGLFGSSKYVTKYYFYNTSEAFEEMEKDLKQACKYGCDRIEDTSYSSVKTIVEEYSKDLQKELKDKAEELKKLLN